VAGHPYRMRLLLTLAFTLFIAADAVAAPPPALPSVTAYGLDRAKVTLPSDFAAPLNILILSFQRDQQPAVDGWFGALGTKPGVQTWLLPISQRENILYRWWLNASLRGSQSPSQPRKYTVPLYVNKTEFLRALQVSSEQDVVLLLTDKAGHVLWRTAGPVNDSKKAELNGFLARAAH
jgi:hypothetical protein